MNHRNIPSATNGEIVSPSYLEPYLIAFAQDLAQQGFTPLTISGYIASVSHFGTWLQKNAIPVEKMGSQIVADFANHQCHCPGRRKRQAISRKYSKRVQRFVSYLALSKIILSESDRPPAHRNPLLVAFTEHLNQRGLADTTLASYERSIRTSATWPICPQPPRLPPARP